MIAAAAVALVLSAEVATRGLEAGERRAVLLLAGLIAVMDVPLLAYLLSPATRLWYPPPPNRDLEAEALLRLCGGRHRRPRREPVPARAAPRHLESLFGTARTFWLLI